MLRVGEMKKKGGGKENRRKLHKNVIKCHKNALPRRTLRKNMDLKGWGMEWQCTFSSFYTPTWSEVELSLKYQVGK